MGGGYGPAREALDDGGTAERLAGLEREFAGIVEAADSASDVGGKWRNGVSRR